MNYVYPAIFYPKENGTYSVIFPDLYDLATQGNTLADAMAMATEACAQYLFTCLREGGSFPTPSTLDRVAIDEPNAFANMILVNLTEYSKKYNDKAVKKTLSIPMWLNKACEESNINFSKVLQEALIVTLQIKS